MKNKGMIWILVSCIIILVIALVVFVKFWVQTTYKAPGPVACTMEAKICPDGSTVGRVGPKCEFTPCPVNNTSTVPLGWKTFTDPTQGIAFAYPEMISAKYIFGQEWPPKITVSNEQFSCSTTEPTSSLPARVTKLTTNGHTYCISATSGGAAGSIYTDYIYTTEVGGKLASISFTLQYPQCVNYEDPQKTECQNERQSFNLDGLIDQIISTLKFTK